MDKMNPTTKKHHVKALKDAQDAVEAALTHLMATLSELSNDAHEEALTDLRDYAVRASDKMENARTKVALDMAFLQGALRHS